MLGDLRVERDGDVVGLPASKRTRALLGFLIATGRAETRQSLCDLLWDGPDDPRAALRWSLTKLRAVLDDERLIADRERVAFRVGGAVIDLTEARALLSPGVARADITALEAAAPMLAGEFLDGLDLPACHRFHHWCMTEREAMGALRRNVLGELTRRLFDVPERALPYVRALIAADPLSEEAHGSLVRLLVRLGRADEAEAHCRRAADMLRHEVGAAQAEVLRSALRDARVRHRSAELAPQSDAAASAPTAPQQPGLVGRTSERALIEGSIAALKAGRTVPLLFLGAPGIGKTRLLAEAASAARPRARIIATRCFEAEMVRPYGCIADGLRGLPSTLIPPSLRGPLALLLPELGLVSSADRPGLIDSIAELLRLLAAEQPIVLLLDDLQWIDEASSALLHALVRRAIPGVLVVGAARDGEIDDNPWAKRLVTSLTHDGGLKMVSLAALTQAEIARLIGVPPDSESAAEAFRLSGGNPLLAVELARARRRGASLDGHGIETLVADQLARLDDDEREVLDCAAVIGRELHPELLETGLARADGALLGRLRRLERLGLLRALSQGQYDFAHGLVRQCVYRLLSQPHRRLLHRRIAFALSAAAPDDPSLYGDLVHHAGLAEDHATAAKACVIAGEHCLRVFANAEAATTAERGLAHLEHLPSGRERIRQTVALLSVRAFAGSGAARRDSRALLDAVEKAGDAAELAGLFAEAAHAHHVAAWLYAGANDTERARIATLRAERISRTADTATRCQQLANTGRCLLEVDSAAPRAFALIEDATTMAEAHNLRFVELEWGRALAARWRGDLAQAAVLMGDALALSRIVEDRWREAECLARLAGIALERGNLIDVEELCLEIQLVMSRMELAPSAFADALLSIVRLRRSDPAASASVRTSLASLRALDDKVRLAYVLNEYASSLLESRNLSGAREAAGEAAALAREVKSPTEQAVADALMTRAATASADFSAAATHLAAARATSDSASRSARARSHVERAAGVFAAAVPTLLQTEAG